MKEIIEKNILNLHRLADERFRVIIEDEFPEINFPVICEESKYYILYKNGVWEYVSGSLENLKRYLKKDDFYKSDGKNGARIISGTRVFTIEDKIYES